MRASQESQHSTHYRSFYSRPMQKTNCYVIPSFHVLNNESRPGSTERSSQTFSEQFFTLESNPTTDFPNYGSPSVANVSSSRSPFSPPGSHSYASDLRHTPDNTYGSPLSGGASGVEDENKLLHALWVLRHELLGPESETDDSGFYNGIVDQLTSPFSRYNKILEMAHHMDLKQLLLTCAEIISEVDSLPLSERQVLCISDGRTGPYRLRPLGDDCC